MHFKFRNRVHIQIGYCIENDSGIFISKYTNCIDLVTYFRKKI